MENDKDKLNRKLKRTIFIMTFSMYFFRMFAPLFLVGVILLIAGIFRKEFLLIGAVFLVLDAVLSVLMMIRMYRIQSRHPEFEKVRKALAGGDFIGDMDKLDREWAGSGFYSARVDGYRDDAMKCSTVGEAFEVYKKHCLYVVTGEETYIFTAGPDKKYFMDGGRYYVISFDRMREIHDDVECHMYFDLLFDPDKMSGPKTTISTENCIDEVSNLESYLNSVEEFLKDKDLMSVPLEKTNIGTDE